MNVLRTLLLCIVAAPALATAQRPAPAPAPAPTTQVQGFIFTTGQLLQTLTINVPGAACPVSMEARQGMDGGMLRARRDQDDVSPETLGKPGQVIHLVLGQPASGKRIVVATVKVSGLSARGQITGIPASEPKSDIFRTLNVTLYPDGDNAVYGTLKLPGFTSVRSIQLQTITFADGTFMDATVHPACSVKPNPLMLVAGR